MVFYSADNGRAMFWRVSSKPYSIARFSKAYTVGTNTPGFWGYTYPNPLRADGRLWLLFRGANWQPSVHAPRGALVAPAQDARPRAASRDGAAACCSAAADAHRPYRQVRERRQAHPRDVHRGQPRRTFRTRSGTPWFDRTGDLQRLRPPRARDSAPRRRSSASTASARTPATSSGRSTSPSARSGRSSSYRRRTLRPEYWSGPVRRAALAQLPHHPLRHTPRSPGAVGGATLDHEDPSIVYLSRLTPDRPGHEVEVWRTPDGGRSWQPDDDHAVRGPTTCGRSAARGLTRYSQVLWVSGRRTFRTSFDTRILTASPRRAARGR